MSARKSVDGMSMMHATESTRRDAETQLDRVVRELELARKLAALAGCDYRTTLGALRVGLHRVRSLTLRARIAQAAALLGIEVAA